MSVQFEDLTFALTTIIPLEIIGYIASLFIGISLGLIGGGGSVLTVPILVYLFKVDPVLATAYSLFIVGSSSAIGTFQKMTQKDLNFRVALTFGIPSIITVWLIRKFLIPTIPDIIWSFRGIAIEKGFLMLILFSILMIIAAAGMLKPRPISRPVLPEFQGLVTLGVFVGIISGLLGAGGGFVIIPALIFYASMEIKKAVGTSLLIISLNSLVGFTGDLHNYTIDWSILLPITFLGIAGTFIGNKLSVVISAEKIKKIFAWFIMITGISIIMIETINLINLN